MSKTIRFKKSTNYKKGIKFLSIRQKNEDKECVTDVSKSFIYHVTSSVEVSPNSQQPQIFIKKEFDQKNKVEKFNFKVKGCFYLNQDRFLYKVSFQHQLCICINWKTNIFSPKKSEVLT